MLLKEKANQHADRSLPSALTGKRLWPRTGDLAGPTVGFWAGRRERSVPLYRSILRVVTCERVEGCIIVQEMKVSGQLRAPAALPPG
jgi:hypothetical protein